MPLYNVRVEIEFTIVVDAPEECTACAVAEDHISEELDNYSLNYSLRDICRIYPPREIKSIADVRPEWMDGIPYTSKDNNTGETVRGRLLKEEK